MKAGFLSLFRRSLYRGTASRVSELEVDSAQHIRIHEERERFAAASIAFCLEHDRAFRHHFLKKVCGRTGVRKLSVMSTVEIEPRRWADLLLKSGDFLCAVEIKIGARLADHQNPTRKVFFKPGGYGHFVKEHCREHNSHPRYIVLGCESNLGLEKKKKIRKLEVRQRSWDDLGNGLPATPLTKDLVLLLSSFGVWQFTFKAMKDKKLSGELGDVGSAVRILESVRDRLGWPASSKVIADPGDENWWGLGIYLNPYSGKKTVKGLAERLQRDNDVPKNTGVAWFGYFATPGEKATRSVYVYCSQTARKRLVERLESARFNVDDQERDVDNGPYCAVVRAGHDKLGDIEWFKMALEAGAETR